MLRILLHAKFPVRGANCNCCATETPLSSVQAFQGALLPTYEPRFSNFWSVYIRLCIIMVREVIIKLIFRFLKRYCGENYAFEVARISKRCSKIIVCRVLRNLVSSTFKVRLSHLWNCIQYVNLLKSEENDPISLFRSFIAFLSIYGWIIMYGLLPFVSLKHCASGFLSKKFHCYWFLISQSCTIVLKSTTPDMNSFNLGNYKY